MNQRDIEQLSEYLDGRLNASDSARLESRLASDPALASALEAMRASRALLRRMPKRRAPRNFTLTPAMVGRKPPLPRSYPVLRFATALATVLFALSFVTNRVGQLAASAPAAAPYGMGGGGGNAATEAPAMEMALATEPSANAAPTETVDLPSAPAEDQTRIAESGPAAKTAGAAPPAPPLFTQWQILLAVIAIFGAAAMLFIRQLAARKWRAK